MQQSMTTPSTLDLPIPKDKLGSFPISLNDLNDSGNAEMFVNLSDGNFVYINNAGGWHFWDGRRFQRDICGSTFQFMQKIVQTLLSTVVNIGQDPDLIKKLCKHIQVSLDYRKLVAALSTAAKHVCISKPSNQADTNPYLVNVQNGTIDLLTGKIRPHDKADLITKLTPIMATRDAQCPKWIAFLDTIFAGDQELIAYVRRVVGLCLSGDMNHQCFFLLYGVGANGKSVFISVLARLLGDYFTKASSDFLMKTNDGTPKLELAGLAGVRCLVASEVAEGCALNELLLKDLTGGETVRGRHHYSDWIDIRPICKILIVGNHRPHIRGTDYGVWRRVRMIPFTVTIPEDRRRPFNELVDDICTELSGILTWTLEGWRDYKKNGLGQCSAVTGATGTYRSENDLVGSYLVDRIEKTDTTELSKEVYGNYRTWCKETGEYEFRRRVFDERMTEHGYKQKRENRGLVWEGLRIIPESTQEPRSQW